MIESLPEKPKFSVVTVSLNHAEFLEKNIQSVLNQGYENFEHIIIDGGSTDNTLEILKKYPHLQWVSEPDRGQSHALNKGFSRATGDIIAWLNSDDRYPDEPIFHDVADALKESAIVMGKCQMVDREGNEEDIIENVGRNWYDLLRYWISYASPSQPALFFRRDLLEQVKYETELYVDESLNFSMDLDLWLRIAKHTDLTQRLDKILAVYPIYDESKTGGDWDPIYKEMSRVFRRHQSQQKDIETTTSVIVKCSKTTPVSDLDNTLRTLAEQKESDFEIVLYSDGKLSEEITNTIESYKKNIFPGLVRCIKRSNEMPLKEFLAIHTSSLNYLFTEPGVTFHENFISKLQHLFLDDPTALILLGEESLTFTHDKALNDIYLHNTFAMRSVAFHEIYWQAIEESIPIAVKEICIKLAVKGWRIEQSHDLLKQVQKTSLPRETIDQNYFSGMLLKSIYEALKIQEEDSFHSVRADNGWALSFDEDTKEKIVNFTKQR